MNSRSLSAGSKHVSPRVLLSRCGAGLRDRVSGAGALELLECRTMLNSAFSLIHLDQLRNDPLYSSVDGSGIGVMVLDSGIDSTHPLLAGAFRGGVDLVARDTVSLGMDLEGHGTHVSGTIAARNREIGVAPAAGIVMGNVGVGGTHETDDAATVQGIYWAIDHQSQYNIRVINMSLGNEENYASISEDQGDAFADAIARAEAVGISVVSAAGNSYIKFNTTNPNGVSSPAILSTLMVGAVADHYYSMTYESLPRSGSTDNLAFFSQRLAADSRMILAPGVDITSARSGGGTKLDSGTSMSAPIVSGVVALMQDAAMTFGGRYLTPSEVRDIIVTSGVQVRDTELPGDNVINTNAYFKRLDAYEAVKLVRTRLAPNSSAPPDPGAGNTIPDDIDGTLNSAAALPVLSDGAVVYGGGRGSIGTDAGGVRIGPKDVDLYRITVLNTSQFLVRLSTDTTAPADFDSYLRIFNSSGTEIAADDNSNGLFSGYTSTLSPGTYYIGVSGKGNTTYAPGTLDSTRLTGAQGNYTMLVLLLDLSSNDRDGTIARAVPTILGSPASPTRIDGSIGNDDSSHPGAGDVDMYRIVVPDSGFVLADIDSLGTSYTDTYLRFFNASGNQLAANDDAPATNPFGQAVEATGGNGTMVNLSNNSAAGRATDSFLRVQVARGDIIYVAVSHAANSGYSATNVLSRNYSGSEGDYSLYLTFSSNDVNGSIDRAVDTAVPFTGVGDIGFDQGTLNVGSKDVDFFHIRTSSDQLLTTQLNSTQNFSGNPNPFDATLSLYDASGKLLGFVDDANGQDPKVTFYAYAGTDYYVAATGFGNTGFDPMSAGSGSGGATGRYQIQISTTALSQAFVLANDDIVNFSGIQAVNPGFSGTFNLGMDGTLVVGDDDVDFYRFVAPSTGLLATYISRTHDRSADAVLRLFDAGGNELTTSFDSSLDKPNDDTLLSQVTGGQTYYIGVSAHLSHTPTYDARTAGTAESGSTGGYTLSVGFGTQRPSISAPNASRVLNGQQVTAVNISATAPSARAAIFLIDFNRDGVFGDGEQVGTDADSSNGFSVTLPIDRKWAPGNYMMGVVGLDSNGIPSPIATTMFELRPNYAYRIFYPEGWANESSIDQFVPLVNPNNVAIQYRVIAHYERSNGGDAGAALSFIVAEGTLQANSRGGVSMTTRGGIGHSIVNLQRGYAIEVQSTLPIGATLSHYDTFDPTQAASGVATGEALTNITSTSWFFSNVIKNPATNREYLLFFNPNDTAASVTVTFDQGGSVIASATFPVYANSRWGLAINDLPALTGGSYGVVVSSTIPVLAAQSAYTTDGYGDSSIGIPGTSGAQAPASGVIPFVDRSNDLTSRLSFINSNASSVDVLLTARDQQGVSVTRSLTIGPRSVMTDNLTWVTGLTGTAFSIEYAATGPLGVTVAQDSASRGDSTFYPAMSTPATAWAVADAYLYRVQAGVRYFENLSVFNPNNAATSVTVDFLLYDRSNFIPQGQSDRISHTYTIPAHTTLTIPMHAPDSLVMTYDNRPEVWFSLVARASVPIYTTFTHWDLNQGGGWDSWATPVA